MYCIAVMVPPASLQRLISVVPVGPGTFRGVLQPTRARRVFGGQLLGQALSAAAATAAGHPWPGSLHAYFISRPLPDAPLDIDVVVRRDGRSHAWRHLVARQGEQPVLEAVACFRSGPAEEVRHAPPAPGPETLRSPDEEIARSSYDLKAYYDRLGPPAADVRYVRGTPRERTLRNDKDLRQEIWLRPYRPVAADPLVSAAAIAYISDLTLMSVPLVAQGILGDGSDALGSSFDHVLRFYAVPDRLEWVYYQQRAEVSGARTVEASGLLLDRDGRLIASVSQQGVVQAGPQRPANEFPSDNPEEIHV